MISTRATDMATRIEMTDASRARPSQTAETSQTFSIAPSFRPAGRSLSSAWNGQ
ncbi:Uncharacterised protein [Mycobacterium tuberculosis]|nr:Uncharacterised protein [Mycobacterium tuberculosis]